MKMESFFLSFAYYAIFILIISLVVTYIFTLRKNKEKISIIPEHIKSPIKLIVSVIIFFSSSFLLRDDYVNFFLRKNILNFFSTNLKEDDFLILFSFTVLWIFKYASLFYLLQFFIKRILKSFNFPTERVERVFIKPELDKFFNEEDFYKTLRTVLPKGVKDEKHGLDFISYMIHVVDEKRERFKKDANKFLNYTLALGIVATIFVVYFSYQIFDDKSSSLYTATEELRINVIDLAKNSKFIKAKNNIEILDSENIEFYYFENLYSNSVDSNSVKMNNEILKQEALFKADKITVKQLSLKIDSINNLTYENNNLNEQFSNNLHKLNSNISDLNNSIEQERREVSTTVNSIQKELFNLDKALQEPQRKLDDLLKRLALGIIVSTFLLAILRYTARLYQSNFSEMLKAENEDLMIRKFYVALVNTESNAEIKKMIFEKLLSEIDNKQENKSTTNLTQEESGILKDIINALLKKIS